MRVGIGLGIALLTTALAGPAQASTGGQPDGEQHPAVGLLLAYSEGGFVRCSGTLIAPDVVLTAAHCTEGLDGQVLVDFRSEIADQPPVGYPEASDAGAGFTAEEIDAAGFAGGTPVTHPAYSGFTDLKNWNDVGLVLLDREVTGIAPAELAPQGTLDRIPRSKLGKTLFRAVGYGVEMRKPETGPQRPTPFTYPLLRRYVDMPGQKLTAQILQTNGNDKDPKGTGGTCFGDSGGPVFLGGRIVAVTSYGFNENCRYLGGYQRIDIAPSADFIAAYLGAEN